MPNDTNFFWATFFILYDPLELSTGACPTPSGTEIVKTHHCAVVVSQWDEIISERLFHAIYLFVFFIFHTQGFMNTEFKFFMKNLLKVSRCSRNDPSKKNFNSYGKQ